MARLLRGGSDQHDLLLFCPHAGPDFGPNLSGPGQSPPQINQSSWDCSQVALPP